MAHFMMSRNFQDALHDIRLTEKYYPSIASIFCFNGNYFSENANLYFLMRTAEPYIIGNFRRMVLLGVIINTE